MVRANGIDLFDLAAERHRFVNQKLNEMIRGGFSGQQFELFVDPIDPSAADAGTNLWGVGRRSVRRRKKQGTGAREADLQ